MGQDHSPFCTASGREDHSPFWPEVRFTASGGLSFSAPQNPAFVAASELWAFRAAFGRSVEGAVWRTGVPQTGAKHV